MKAVIPIPNTPEAAEAVASEMIPATDLATETAVRAARTVALLIEQTSWLRGTPAGAELPLAFAEHPISLARRAFDAAFETRSLFIEARLSSAKLIGELGYGSACPCRNSGIDAREEAVPISRAA